MRRPDPLSEILVVFHLDACILFITILPQLFYMKKLALERDDTFSYFADRMFENVSFSAFETVVKHK